MTGQKAAGFNITLASDRLDEVVRSGSEKLRADLRSMQSAAETLRDHHRRIENLVAAERRVRLLHRDVFFDSDRVQEALRLCSVPTHHPAIEAIGRFEGLHDTIDRLSPPKEEPQQEWPESQAEFRERMRDENPDYAY